MQDDANSLIPSNFEVVVGKLDQTISQLTTLASFNEKTGTLLKNCLTQISMVDSKLSKYEARLPKKSISSEIDGKLDISLGQIANIENSNHNLDILIKACLANISTVSANVSNFEAHYANDLTSIIGKIDLSLGQISNIENSNLNVDILVKDCLSGIRALSAALPDFRTFLSTDLCLSSVDGKLDHLINKISNIENANFNIDLLLKECLRDIQMFNSRPLHTGSNIDPSAVMTDPNAVRLAAIESAALTKGRTIGVNFPTPVFKDGLEDWPTLLKDFRPNLFNLWMGLYETSLPHYEDSVEASCSTWDNRFAVAFRDYLSLFAEGFLLDIGSGTLKCPVYLEGYPTQLLRGLDPRKAKGEVEFEIATGVNEFLPWLDGGFQTVCNATSLDHVIDLERALDETARVLCDSGRFIIWYANIPGSPEPTNSTTSGAVAVDEFHLFHLNDEWFLPMLEKRFRVLDRRVFPSGGFEHVFAVYETL